jgi:hypothetical protein
MEAMVVVLGVLGMHFWDKENWNFYPIFATGFLLVYAGMRYQKWVGNKEAVEEAMRLLRAELETNNPKLVCLMVKTGGTCSKEIQRPLWTLKSLEVRHWSDSEEIVTLIRTIEKP